MAQADIVRAGFLVLGAALALSGGIAVEVWRTWRADCRNKSLIESILREEMLSMAAILGAIEPEHFPPQTPVGRIQERFQALNNARLRVERYRHLFMLIKEVLGNDLYDFLWRVEVLCLETASRVDDPIETYSETIARLREKGEGLVARIDKL